MSHDPRHYDIIVSPVITEKATIASEHNKVTFKVRMDATKTEIKAAALTCVMDTHPSGNDGPFVCTYTPVGR